MEEIEMEKEALTTHANTLGNKSDWVVELEKEIRKDVETSGSTSPVVFRVAEDGFSATEQHFYIPSVVSIGPYHFGRVPELNRMEPHKLEAVRRMQKRLNGRLQSIVETEIVAMDKSIREFYDKELSHSAIDLAWMVTKDSCFLFEFILNYIRTRRGYGAFHNDCVVEGRYDAVFSSSLTTPTCNCILYDLVRFEHQIPLSVLEHLLAIAFSASDPQKILGDIFSGIAGMENHLIFRWGMGRSYEKQKTLHYLEVLYYRHVGWDLDGYKQKAYALKDRRLLQFGWTKSIFAGYYPRWMRGTGKGLRHSFLSFAHSTVAYCRLQIVRVRNNCLGSWPRSNTGDEGYTFRLKLPSAAELKKKGINLCVVTSKNSTIVNDREGIRWIQFEEKTSTLYLPEVRIDHFRHALWKNFIALEYTSRKYSPFPITAFAFFMDELVDSEEDVAVLREANIIKNFFGSNKEAAECFNSLTRSCTLSEGCKTIKDARVGLHNYLKREYKILWNEFKSTYFAKPWLVAGCVGATLLLLMTLVFCLFYTCNDSH